MIDDTSLFASKPTVYHIDKSVAEYGSPGATTRLMLAAEMAKSLLAVLPWQAMSRHDVVKEAYRFADELMAMQHIRVLD